MPYKDKEKARVNHVMRSRRWRKLNKEKIKTIKKKADLKGRYGISEEIYLQMVKNQNNLCAICNKDMGEGRTRHIDHCHKTGIVRGLLCSGCNRGIGCFKESLTALQNAIEYLKRSLGNPNKESTDGNVAVQAGSEFGNQQEEFRK